MSSPDVKMNYDSMNNMENAFKQAASQIQDSINQMNQVAQTLEGGALLGQAGSAFSDAIKSKLVPNMKTISDGMSKLANDVHLAEEATRTGVSNAQARFA